MSYTTPIAVEISSTIGGLPYLTAGVAILNFLGIHSPSAIGTALGTASHGIGTARALDLGDLAGAYSGLAMCMNGILTSLIAPFLIDWLIAL